MPRDTPSESKFVDIKKWLLGSWPGVFVIIFSFIGGIFGAGFWAGSYITRTEANHTIMELRLEHQNALSEQKDKAEEKTLQEIRKERESMEAMYRIIYQSGGKNEK